MFLSVLVADQKRFSQWEFGLKSDARNFVFAPSGQGFFPSNVPARRHSVLFGDLVFLSYVSELSLKGQD